MDERFVTNSWKKICLSKRNCADDSTETGGPNTNSNVSMLT